MRRLLEQMFDLDRTALVGVAVLLLAVTASAEFPVPGPVPEKPTVLSVGRNQPQDERPFWKKKPQLLEKIRDERAILVSVRADNAPKSDEVIFTMNGAGVARQPKDFCFRTAQDYPRLKEISEHFKTVSFDLPTRQLFIVTEALGYQARMVMRVTPVSEDWRSELQWEVIWGHFKGMTGLIGFENIDAGRTEMSLSARYQASELPLPKALVGFALEVVMQKVAEKMRTYIESAPELTGEQTKSTPK
jgi:hypothetical protein